MKTTNTNNNTNLDAMMAMMQQMMQQQSVLVNTVQQQGAVLQMVVEDVKTLKAKSAAEAVANAAFNSQDSKVEIPVNPDDDLFDEPVASEQGEDLDEDKDGTTPPWEKKPAAPEAPVADDANDADDDDDDDDLEGDESSTEVPVVTLTVDKFGIQLDTVTGNGLMPAGSWQDQVKKLGVKRFGNALYWAVRQAEVDDGEESADAAATATAIKQLFELTYKSRKGLDGQVSVYFDEATNGLPEGMVMERDKQKFVDPANKSQFDKAFGEAEPRRKSDVTGGVMKGACKYKRYGAGKATDATSVSAYRELDTFHPVKGMEVAFGEFTVNAENVTKWVCLTLLAEQTKVEVTQKLAVGIALEDNSKTQGTRIPNLCKEVGVTNDDMKVMWQRAYLAAADADDAVRDVLLSLQGQEIGTYNKHNKCWNAPSARVLGIMGASNTLAAE